MKIGKQDKIDYITNYFHQYYDISLNKNIVTTDFVNLVMPLDSLSNIGWDKNDTTTNNFAHSKTFSGTEKIGDILEKYDNVSFDDKDLVRVVGQRVIDGDTLDVVIPRGSQYDENSIDFTQVERVRLVGVNTPEERYDGYESSKLFLEKLVYTEDFFEKNLDTENYEWQEDEGTLKLYGPDDEDENKFFTNTKRIRIKIDSKRQRDKYNRLLAVLVIENKNINEILLKEGFGEIMYIPPSEFNPFDWGDINTPISVHKFKNTTINFLSRFFNSDYSNIVFTPQNDVNTIYPCQVYKNVIYVKLFPFSQQIRMHLLPKQYDCSDNLLFLTDDMLDKRTILQSSKNHYKIYEDRGNINAYYQVNGEDRDRSSLQPNAAYNYNDWENEWCEFDYDISKDSTGFKNIQICAGYSYNNTSPYHALHYMGVKDNSNRAVEDRAFLVDVNTDKVLNKRNIITQMIPDDKNDLDRTNDIISTPPHNNIRIYNSYQDDINHVDVIHKTHHKIIKYIHDSLYSEEDMNIENKNKKQYTSAEWIDLLKEE